MVTKGININILSEYINKYVQLWDFYGVIQIIKDGDIVFENCYGYASLAFDIKNTINTRFTLASLTKQFTAFAIMILYDRKMTDIDKPANSYLPDDMQIPDDITVHHLLSHTSGLHNNYNFDENLFIGDDRMIFSKREFFRNYILCQPTENPGTQYNYNNSNYNLLAWIIENVSGMGYEEFLKENIFKTLSMDDTEVDDGIKILVNKAENYVRDYERWVKAFKLYDIDKSGNPVLYFYASPLICSRESYTGLYSIKNGTLNELVIGYECGGTAGGNYVSFFKDTETSRILIGDVNNAGGIMGSANSSDIYEYQNGEAKKIVSYGCIGHKDANRYEELWNFVH